MKKFLMILFFSVTCAHALWVPVTNITPEREFANKALCERLTQDTCVNKPDYCYSEYCSFQNEMVDDEESPIWATRSMIEACAGESECQQALQDKDCIDGRHAIVDAEFSEVWCNKITGYEQVATGRKVFVIDQQAKAQYEQEQAQKKAQEEAIDLALKKMDCGKRVVGLMGVLNQSKIPALTIAQVKLSVDTFAPIKDYLESGALETAKTQVQQVQLNDPIVTATDKVAIIAKIESCLE